MVLIVISSIVPELNFQAYSYSSTQNTSSSPITIYKDTYTPNSEVHIRIYAPDFNSNPYAIDTIGDDSENKIIISTRESSIPYRLVETGTDTGIFEGYVTLSGTTSTCSPICGPTDGFLTAGGDDAITVSFIYAGGRTITSSVSIGSMQDKIDHKTIPEFGSLTSLIILISTTWVIIFSRRFVKN